jgi:hypothetical protein
MTTLALCSMATACGGTDQGASSIHSDGSQSATGSQHGPPMLTTNYSTRNNDRDNDGDHNDDDEGVLKYGHPASPADERSSIALVKRYFAAADAENGARGCSMLVPFIAESLPEEEAHTPVFKGSTCAAVLTKLFRYKHRLIAKKQRSLRVIGVRVEGNSALAVVYFSAIPEVREMHERRIGGTWRFLEALDGNLE